ncbi:MAG TPA: DEAD/DEAH box helicase, partial [Chloroflexota bacterium]|nr:DEAD/DEAH box helicase [Chloroflexota bacterium]
MVTQVRPDTLPETRLAGLALVSSASGQYVALAFDGDRVVERLSGHVDSVVDAVKLAELADGRPIISDSPRRALDALVRAGVRSPIVWDLLELAALLAPACPNDSLERATTFFGIVLDGSGLACQAERVLMLFQLLVAMLDGLDTQTLLHVTRLANGLDWPLRLVFNEAQRRRALSALETGALAAGSPIGAWVTQGTAPRRRQASVPDADPPPLDAEDIARRLAPEASIAHTLPGYEARHEQVHMAQLVGETLSTGGQLLIEAGTGTGKSLAYLLPAALRAVRANRRVVVSTATTTLQDQLFEQDLPLVRAGLAGEPPLRATVLKGRTNYLCLRRWQLLLHAGDLTPADRMLLIKTLFWLPRTTTGDRAELHLSPGEDEAWQRVCAVAEACTPLRCTFHRIGVCFLARARRAAEESHIVIANHALLLSDLASRSRVLPDYDALIVDEAHHLEDEATQQLGWRLGERELLSRLERVWSPGGGGSGAVPEAVGLIGTANGLRVPAELQPILQQGERAVL